MKRFILSFILSFATAANANLQICPRMPTASAVANQWISAISAAGAVTQSRPAFTDISGTVSAAQLPNPSSSTLGGVQSFAAVSSNWIRQISTAGVPTASQPAFTDISGSIATSQVNSGTNASATTFYRGDNTWAAPTVVYAPATTRALTSGTTYNKNYSFIITSGSATVGATYTNNAVTFTVYATVASATLVVMNGSGPPAASGTLTKSGGVGDSTLTFSAFIAPLYLKIKMVGGGGGGSGGGASAGAGGNGGDTTWGSVLTAGGGIGGTNSGSASSAGGTGTITAPAIGMVWPGARGGGTVTSPGIANGWMPGGAGGASCVGGNGGSGASNTAGFAAPANTGGGGGGGPSSLNSGQVSGGGGGAGACIEAVIPSPSATYTYAIGAAGTAGSTGTFLGGAGSAGFILVEEHYQ